MQKSIVWSALVGLSIILGPATADAALFTTTCPTTPGDGVRIFSITIDATAAATCLDDGAGNVNGTNDAINELGFVTLDKSDDLVTGEAPGSLTGTPSLTSGLSGEFSFTPLTGYKQYVIAFKTGEGKLDPDWAAFLLPVGVTSGEWSITGKQELSHALLYRCDDENALSCYTPPCETDCGEEPEDPPTDVPEPTSVALIGLGLLGASVIARRRR